MKSSNKTTQDGTSWWHIPDGTRRHVLSADSTHQLQDYLTLLPRGCSPDNVATTSPVYLDARSLTNVPLMFPWILATTHARIDESLSVCNCDSSSSRQHSNRFGSCYHGNNVRLVSDNRQHANQWVVTQNVEQPITFSGETVTTLGRGEEQQLEQPPRSNVVTMLIGKEESVFNEANGGWQHEINYKHQVDVNIIQQCDGEQLNIENDVNLRMQQDNNEKDENNNGRRQCIVNEGFTISNDIVQSYIDDEDVINKQSDNNVQKQQRNNVAKTQLHLGSCGRRKKQLKPRRSALWDDPKFRGVIVRMKTLFDGEQCRLDMSCEYRLGTKSTNQRTKARVVSYHDSLNSNISSPISSHVTSDSQSDSEFNCPELDHRCQYVNMNTCYVTPVAMAMNKECASCRVRKTPLWRDAEDGTPLCNACGIRYKKYRVRCGRCWNIPKKDTSSSKSSYHCTKCGDLLRLAFGHRANKIW